MVPLFLFLHVMGAIAVFGPVFAFPVIGGHASRAPQHGHFAALVSDAIERRIVIPGAIVQGITGVVLVFLTGLYPNLGSGLWLSVAIVLYVIAVAFAITIQAPASGRMVELTAGGPPPSAAPVAGEASLAAAPAGPPPQITATARRLALGGRVLTVLVVAIVVLMVTKPGI